MDIGSAKDICADRNKQAFREWFADAPKGAKVIYHRGEYCAGWFKAQALEMAQGGLIDLVQVRLAPRQFAYVAVKRKDAK